MKSTIAMIVVITLLIVGVILGLAQIAQNVTQDRKQSEKVITSDTTVCGRSLTTIKHDDHLFVVLTYSGNGACGSVIHSPSCPCLIERK